MRKDLSSAIAAIIGSLPGFTLPFAAAFVLSPHESDVLLLAVSIAVAVTVVVSSAVELTTIAEYGRLLGKNRNPAADAFRSFRRRVLMFSGLVTIVVVPTLALAYSMGIDDRRDLVALVCAVAATPVVAAMSSLLSGECVARGNSIVPIAVQAMRSLLPVVLLLAWTDAPLVVVAVMLPVGEAVRTAMLGMTVRRLRTQQADTAATGELTPHGLVAHALSSGTAQLGPTVDRLFLSSAGAGYISSYEMADRLMYAAAQFLSMTFIFRRVAAWSRLPTMGSEESKALLRRDALTLGAATTAVTTMGLGTCILALVSGLLPADWSLGFGWGAIVMLSVPAYVFAVVSTRLLVVARKQHYMLAITIVAAALNAVLDAAFFAIFGPVGIIVVTVVLRWALAILYLAVLRRVVPRTIGEALTQDRGEKPEGR
jgi:O-antigen/teichoic acid export membrane protein